MTVQPYSATAQVKSLAGSAAAPGITFTGDIDTGLFSPGANQVAISTNGTERLRVDATGLSVASDALINGLTVGRGGSESSNTVLGLTALSSNTSGYRNTAIGQRALQLNTTGAQNTAIGRALEQNIGGSENTAVGRLALYGNISGNYNVAIGNESLQSTDASNNTATGFQSLFLNTTGANNTCYGYRAGYALTTGSNNTIIGNVQGTAGLASTVIIGAGSTERLRIDSSGNMGLGTSSPAAKLDVVGTLKILNANSAFNFSSGGIRLGQYADYSYKIGIFAGNVSNHGRGPLIFALNNLQDTSSVTAAQEVVRITENGGLAIGPPVGGNVATQNQPILSLYGSRNGGALTSVIGIDLSPTLNISSGSSGVEYGVSITPTFQNTHSTSPSGRSLYVKGVAENANVINAYALYVDAPTGAANNYAASFATGNVGIGTTTPNALLTVNGTGAFGAGAAATPSISFTSDLNTGIYSPGADQVAISTNGVQRLSIGSTGHIGNLRSIATAFSGTNAATWMNGLSLTNFATPGVGVSSLIVFEGTSNVNSVFGVTQAGSGHGDFVWAASAGTASERMRLTAGGLLGIGTSAPGAPLNVRFDNAGTTTVALFENQRSVGGSPDAAQIVVGARGYNHTIIRQNSDLGTQAIGTTLDTVISNTFGAALHIATGSPTNAARLTVTSAGLVGIGTTSPSAILDVKVASDAKLLVQDGNTTGNVKLNAVNNAVSANVNLEISASNTQFFNGGSEKARIDSSGRLLVGTSSARSWAGITGQFQLEGTSFNTSSPFFISNSNDQYGSFLLLGKSRGTSIGSNTVVQNGDMIGSLNFAGADGSALKTGANIEAFVDGTPGANDLPTRLVFSVTRDGSASPTETLRIRNTGETQLFSTVGGFVTATSATAGTATPVLVGRHSATTTTDGTNTLIAWSNGNLMNANNSYTGISDVKLKENIVDANSQWDDLKALRPVNYNFKEGQTHTQIGLVAQEVELVSPGLVNESPDRDEEGNDLGTVTKSVQYSVLYMKAVKALQEAMERIEQLETSNADLLARVIALEAN